MTDDRPTCKRCGLPQRRTCDGEGWLDAIGPKADGSYITSRPCPNDLGYALTGGSGETAA